MSELRRYSDYKDSGVPWLGEIPSHWEAKRIKFVVNNINKKVEASETELRYFGLENIESFTGKLKNHIELISEGVGNEFGSGDVLFGKLRPYLSKVYLTNQAGLASTEALILRSTESIEPTFLKYYCLSADFIDQVNGTTFGSKMPRASWDGISSFKITYPSVDEQQAIVSFLDTELEHIDTLISKQKQLIKKLAEQRSAVITHAVTKGLDADVLMKDSGVEWFGEIPENWIMVKLSRLFNIKAGGDLKTDIFSVEQSDDYCYPIYTNSNKPNDVYGFSRESFFPANSITVSGRGYVGFAVYRDHSFDAIIRLLVLMPIKNLDGRFYTYIINNVLDFTENSSAVAQLSTNQIAPYKVPILSIEEQKDIADYLDKEIQKIDEMSKATKDIIAKLQEYRSALITQAVTGKIDVRDIATENRIEEIA